MADSTELSDDELREKLLQRDLHPDIVSYAVQHREEELVAENIARWLDA